MVEPRHRSPALVIAGTPQPGKFKEQQQVQGQARERIKRRWGGKREREEGKLYRKVHSIRRHTHFFSPRAVVHYFIAMLVCPLAEILFTLLPSAFFFPSAKSSSSQTNTLGQKRGRDNGKLKAKKWEMQNESIG
ncbi:hypothetical protein niasHT_029535 [Heterodera trifolii]|uniref:Uncharacterized protein n=1 Tax=Heterodera trifolii TaxID=157864 RepID=A0ABD2JAX6_9BILA